VIAGLTAELASTRSDLQNAIGEKAMAERDHDNSVKMGEEEKTDEDDTEICEIAKTREQLYTRVYDSHLISGMDIDACLREARSDLYIIEKLKNDLFQRRGRMYFGDILKALGYETTECGQNTGWIMRDYPNEYDGYVDFGCWTIGKNPNTGEDMKILNPANIQEDGSIILNFNVEGPIEWMLKEAKKKSAAFRAKDIAIPPISEGLFSNVE
jgi:hypothetical protein